VSEYIEEYQKLKLNKSRYRLEEYLEERCKIMQSIIDDPDFNIRWYDTMKTIMTNMEEEAYWNVMITMNSSYIIKQRELKGKKL
jgi:hypothetical protein